MSDMCNKKAPLTKRDLQGYEVAGFMPSRPTWQKVKGIAGLSDGRVLVCITEKNQQKLALVRAGGKVTDVRTPFVYKEEYGPIMDVSCYNDKVAIVFHQYVAVVDLKLY